MTNQNAQLNSKTSERRLALPVTRRAQGLLLARLLGRLVIRGVGNGLFNGFHSLQSLGLLSLALAALLCGQAAQAADIIIQVEDITDVRGTLFWAVYDNQTDYDAERASVISGRSRVAAESLSVTLHGQPEGEYAIKLFHDANDNGRMDSNLLGLPQEGYGFSNSAGGFGPASFEDAKVLVTGNTQIIVKLR